LSLEHDFNCVYIGSVVMCCLLSTRNRVVFTVGEFYYSSYAFYHCSSVYSMQQSWALFCQLSSKVCLVYECCVWMSPLRLSDVT